MPVQADTNSSTACKDRILCEREESVQRTLHFHVCVSVCMITCVYPGGVIAETGEEKDFFLNL